MTQLATLTQFPIEQFSYNPQTHRFVAEMSDLGRTGTPIVSMVYDDACDVGFKMVGKTRSVVFTLVDQVFDKVENELLHLDFESIDGVYTATIFND
jgi:hypothetical protein